MTASEDPAAPARSGYITVPRISRSGDRGGSTPARSPKSAALSSASELDANVKGIVQAIIYFDLALHRLVGRGGW
jgi:hypothetical protein